MPFNFWTGEGGVAGDFAYKETHLGSIIALLLILIFACLIGRRLSKKSQNIIIVAVSVFALVFEIFWRILYVIRGVGWQELYPFYPCNIAGILVPIIALTKNKTLKEMFYIFAFIGGVITFSYPVDIFTNQYLNFPILKSILQHSFIIFIPVFEYFTGNYLPKIKKYYLAIIGLFVHLFNSEYLPKLLGMKNTDFIFLHSGLPFTIDGVNQVFILAPIAFIVILIFYLFLDRDVFGKKRKRK